MDRLEVDVLHVGALGGNDLIESGANVLLGIVARLFEELTDDDHVGEVAEVLNKRDGRKASDSEDLKTQLANELVDVIHYAFAIASLNQINLNNVILGKGKNASVKYHHERNLEQFLLER